MNRSHERGESSLTVTLVSAAMVPFVGGSSQSSDPGFGAFDPRCSTVHPAGQIIDQPNAAPAPQPKSTLLMSSATVSPAAISVRTLRMKPLRHALPMASDVTPTPEMTDGLAAAPWELWAAACLMIREDGFPAVRTHVGLDGENRKNSRGLATFHPAASASASVSASV